MEGTFCFAILNTLFMKTGRVFLVAVLFALMKSPVDAEDNTAGTVAQSTAAMTISSGAYVAPPVDRVDKAFLKRAVGRIELIDQTSYTLKLREAGGVISSFVLTKRTRASRQGQRVPLSDLKAGERVVIRYVADDLFVRKIMVMENQ